MCLSSSSRVRSSPHERTRNTAPAAKHKKLHRPFNRIARSSHPARRLIPHIRTGCVGKRLPRGRHLFSYNRVPHIPGTYGRARIDRLARLLFLSPTTYPTHCSVDVGDYPRYYPHRHAAFVVRGRKFGMLARIHGVLGKGECETSAGICELLRARCRVHAASAPVVSFRHFAGIPVLRCRKSGAATPATQGDYLCADPARYRVSLVQLQRTARRMARLRGHTGS